VKKHFLFTYVLSIVLVITVGCGAVCSLSGVGFEAETGSFVELSADDSGGGLPDERVVALNSALDVAPGLAGLISGGDGLDRFKAGYVGFCEEYSGLIRKAYRGVSDHDILFCYAVGYALADSVLMDDTDCVLFAKETRERLEDYSGMSFADYVLVHSFWTAYQYLVRTDIADWLSIPWSGDPLGSGLDAPAGIIQIAQTTLEMPVAMLEASPKQKTMFYITTEFDKDTWKYTRDLLLENGLSYGLSISDYSSHFLEVGLIHHFMTLNIEDVRYDMVVLGDLFTTSKDYMLSGADALNELYGGQWQTMTNNTLWSLIIGGEDFNNFDYADWVEDRYFWRYYDEDEP
jgi:hypothetical protein